MICAYGRSKIWAPISCIVHLNLRQWAVWAGPNAIGAAGGSTTCTFPMASVAPCANGVSTGASMRTVTGAVFYHYGMVTPLEIGHPLCWWCEAKFSDPRDNRPHRPHAIDRMATAIANNRLLPRPVSPDVLWNISQYLVSKWEP